MNNSELADYRANKAMILCVLGFNPDNAMKFCDDALEADSNCVNAWLAGAEIFFVKGDYEKSLEYCNKAFELKSKDSRVLRSLAIIREKLVEKGV